jgi:hypothetical protein
VYREAVDRTHLQACIHGPASVAMVGHQRYFLMFGGVSGSNGRLGIRLGRDSRMVTLTIDPVARLSADGSVVISGVLTCDVPGRGGIVGGAGQPAIRPHTGGRAARGDRCDPVPRPWTLAIAADRGRFTGGTLRVNAEASFCGAGWCGSAQAIATARVVAQPLDRAEWLRPPFLDRRD